MSKTNNNYFEYLKNRKQLGTYTIYSKNQGYFNNIRIKATKTISNYTQILVRKGKGNLE